MHHQWGIFIENFSLRDSSIPRIAWMPEERSGQWMSNTHLVLNTHQWSAADLAICRQISGDDGNGRVTRKSELSEMNFDDCPTLWIILIECTKWRCHWRDRLMISGISHLILDLILPTSGSASDPISEPNNRLVCHQATSLGPFLTPFGDNDETRSAHLERARKKCLRFFSFQTNEMPKISLAPHRGSNNNN